MARHELSLRDQLKGVRAAIKSRKTPPQLREGLQKRAKDLERELGIQSQEQVETEELEFWDIFS